MLKSSGPRFYRSISASSAMPKALSPATSSGYCPKTDPAYDPSKWSAKDDQLLSKCMKTTSEGQLQQWSLIAQRYFPDRRPRDLRLRWSTLLKHHDRSVPSSSDDIEFLKSQVKPSTKQWDGVQQVNGRWCWVPKGWATPHPSEQTLSTASTSPLLHIQGDGQIIAKNDKKQESILQRPAHLTVGWTALDLACQQLAETVHQMQEQQRSRPWLEKTKESSSSDECKMETAAATWLDQQANNSRWLEQEDWVLREAVEVYGRQWDQVSKALKIRKRTPDECRLRMEYLCREDTLLW